MLPGSELRRKKMTSTQTTERFAKSHRGKMLSLGDWQIQGFPPSLVQQHYSIHQLNVTGHSHKHKLKERKVTRDL